MLIRVLPVIACSVICAAVVSTAATAAEVRFDTTEQGNGYVNPPPKPVNNDPPMLGVQMTNTNSRVQRDQDLHPGQGVLVRDVYADTAADGLGVQPGDVITNINGSSIGSMSDLRDVVMTSQVGDDVSVIVRRDGKDVALSGARYQAWPEHIPLKPLSERGEARHRDLQNRRLGNAMAQLDDVQRETDQIGRDVDNMQRQAAGEPILDRQAADRVAAADRIPSSLAALPGWRFSYGLTAASSDQEADDTAAPAVVVAPQIDAAPLPTAISYGFTISSEFD